MITSVEQVRHWNSITVSVVSDLDGVVYYHWWLDGMYVGVTAAAEKSFWVETGEQAAIEVLSIVAYNQPVTTDAVNRLRAAQSGAILSQLTRRQLLRVERFDDRPRVANYSTTDRFLSLFGLESLSDLPRSEDIDRQ